MGLQAEEEERELEAVGAGADRGVGRRLHLAVLVDSGAPVKWDSGRVRSWEEVVDPGSVVSVGLWVGIELPGVRCGNGRHVRKQAVLWGRDF